MKVSSIQNASCYLCVQTFDQYCVSSERSLQPVCEYSTDFANHLAVPLNKAHGNKEVKSSPAIRNPMPCGALMATLLCSHKEANIPYARLDGAVVI